MDLETTKSEKSGFSGFFETLLRKFNSAMHMFTMLPGYAFASVVLGLSLTPGVALFRYVANYTVNEPTWFQNLGYGISLAAGYFIYGTCMIFLTPFLNFCMRTSLKAWRGPYYSVESVRWFIHNSLTYLVRFTFLEFVTPSPFGNLFYKMMGMKIGSGVVINSTWISDPSLIEIGRKTTIGGSVTIVAHYGQGGMLVIAPVKIGEKCTIGLKSSIMGGCIIGDGAKILPHSVLLPKTEVPAGETWGGVPAQKIDIKKFVTNSKNQAA